MSSLSDQDIAALVRRYMVGRHVGDITFEVDGEHIRRGDNWWRVPVRASQWPKRMFPIYEEMAEVEEEILENEKLNILLFLGEPIAEEPEPAAVR